MASSTAPNGNNLILGKGALYFDQLDTSGNKTGELHLGNCETFEITPTADMATKKSSMDKSAGVIAQAVKSVQIDLAIKGNEFNKENLALVFLGTTAAFTQGTGTVTSETVTSSAKKGRYYATLYRNISAVTVKAGVAGSTSMTAGTDYTVDAVSGRIYVVPGGGIAVGDIIKVDYTYSAITSQKVIAGTVPNVRGFLRYVSDNSAGDNKEVQIWNAQLHPDGAIGFISDDYADWTIKGTIINDAANHPTEPYFRVIEL